MTRYVALLRGVSPQNAKMPELKACFEQLGFTDVKTVLSSGNVIFSSTQKNPNSLGKLIEDGMQEHLGRSFAVIIRSNAHLLKLLKVDPFDDFALPAEAKKVVTFLAEPPPHVPTLPMELDGAQILAVQDSEVFTTYVPNPRGPVFMTLIEKTFGKSLTTRTWDTVMKCAQA